MFLFLYFDEIVKEDFNDIYIKFYKTALYLAVEKENIEIIKVFLDKDKLDINIKVSK